MCGRQALVGAVSLARDGDGCSPEDAVDLLLDLLEFSDNSGNTLDDAGLVAATLDALGNTRVHSSEVRPPGRHWNLGPIVGRRIGTKHPILYAK
jgi:hypothetical protein